MQLDEATRARFWSKVAKTDECWEWRAATDPRGHGKFWLNRRNTDPKHVAWLLSRGELPTQRICSGCGNVRCVRPEHLRVMAPLSRALGLTPGTTAYKTAWARANRERSRASKQKWANANREKIREKSARYRRENPEKRKAAIYSWAARHPDLVRQARNRSMRKAYKSNPDKFVLREQARRFRNGTVTREEWRAIVESHGGRCVYCGDTATAIDHVIPLSRGGSHTKDNVLPACKPCNSSKSNKLLSEWKGRSCQKSA